MSEENEQIENEELEQEEVLEEESGEEEAAPEEVKEEEQVKDPLHAYALSKGWDPKGTKSAQEFLDYSHRKHTNQVKSLEQSVKMLASKLGEKEKNNAKMAASEFERMMDQAVESGDTEAYKFYKAKHVEAIKYIDKADSEFNIEAKPESEQELVDNFAERNKHILRDEDAYAWTQGMIGTIQRNNPNMSADEVLTTVERKLQDKYGKVDRVPEKVSKPTVAAKAVDNIRESDLYVEHLETYRFLKQDFPNYTLKDFVADMKKENPEFKLRGR